MKENKSDIMQKKIINCQSKNCTIEDRSIEDRPLIDRTVIDRREHKPFLQKAYQLMKWYKTATGCEIAIHSKRYSSLFLKNNNRICHFCNLCKDCSIEYPCMQMHKKVLSQVEQDKSYIYTCNAGFSFWTSPVYAAGLYAGALMSGQVLAIPRKEAVEQFSSFCKGITKKEIADLIKDIPEKKHEEIQALAKLLLICAKKLSSFQNPAIQGNGEVITFKHANTKASTEGSPLHDKERLLLAALRRGDKNETSKILNDLFVILQSNGLSDMDFLKLYAIELTVLVYREAGSHEAEKYNNCLKRLSESETVKELCNNIQYMINSLGLGVFSYSGIRHASALRRAERFIWENYTHKISLEEIAAASGLSAPYFSTIFREEMGKTLFSYLNQLRIEKASSLLRDSSLSIREIAITCGFEDQSWFSKIFRKYTGLSPGKYRMLPATASSAG